MHLADAFIQSDLQCIQAIHLYCRYVYLLNGLMMSLKREVTIFSTLMEHDCDLKRYSTSHSTCHRNSIAQEKHFWHSQLIPVELDISLLVITQSFYVKIKKTSIEHKYCVDYFLSFIIT